jgi:YD repeat-containing protein
MDLGLVLSLNSLIYTRAGSAIHFDPDEGDLGPGFRLGLPEIRNVFINTDAGTQSYLLSMPSGSRVEFRQINTNVYEAVDSSYMLLTHDPVSSVFVLRTTDGTQWRFEDVTGLGDFKCKQIKDRQGNYITITYGSLAEIMTITDALGRVINFIYDGFNHLNSITQSWEGQTHTWATFAYGVQTIQTNFLGLTLNGTTNGAQESVLLRVGLADGSIYSFEYNTYAQVKTIRRYAPNNSNPVNFPGDYFQRSYTTYGLPDNAVDPQADCPRATSRTDWAYDWNPGVTYVYSADPGKTWGQVTFPDGTIYKEFFATTGWQRGLSTQTENWSGGVRKKWTTLQWTQDNTGVSYKLNPRVTETNVYDEAGNRRRTTMSYTSFGLPTDIYEYDANATTVLRHTHTDYNLSAVYTSRRIIGLPSARFLKDGSNNLFSKITYVYDLNPNPNPYLQHPGPTAQHDTANYGPGFVQGRGNLNRTLRWDVTEEDDELQTSKNEIGYNTSGSVIFMRDPLNHQADISYTDSFSDGQNRNTYAYPTTMTDADNFSSTVQYNYDSGAVTRTQSPKGVAVTLTYDQAGRIERKTNVVNGAYTRYVYAPDQRQLETFTTINDLNPANEFRTVTVFDGHDRVRVAVSDHPTSVGQYQAQYKVYDLMGRLAQQSNPTEVNSSWQPAGDDVAGWACTTQTYNWQGRPMVTTNQDGTTKEVLYGGCGCAGGQVVVTRDEVGRRQKMTYDILGRLKTTQTLFVQPKEQPLDGNGMIYSTTTNTCNVRDQITNINVMDNATGASENTVMTYDGHGRLATRKFPIESAANTFAYNADDTLQTMTDPRGVATNYGYNNRKMVTSITYGTAPDVMPLNPVTFGYDEVGNRLWMDDQPGRVDYHYNALSQMEWEERRFDELAQPYRLSYEYNLAGQLKKLTDPWNGSITYTLNSAGEVTAATGNATGQVYGNFDPHNNQLITQFAANVKYRAWGGLKSFTNGDIAGSNFALNYNTRNSLTRFEAGGIVTEHSYYPDGRVQDVIDWYHRPPLTLVSFDRHYVYDHVGRLTYATAGDGTPYSLTYAYDSWGRTKSRTGSNWGNAVQAFNANYDASGRDTTMAYDAAGNVTDHLEAAPAIPRQGYDAAGRQAITKWPNGGGLVNSTQQEGYDGDGLHVRRAFDSLLPPPPTPGTRMYSIRSSVLGGKVIANLAGGADIFTWAVNIYLNGEQIASQAQYIQGGVTHRHVFWWYKEPVIGSLLTRSRRIQMNPITYVIELYTSVSDNLSDPTGGWLDPFGQVERPPVALEWPGSELNEVGNFSGGCHVMGIKTPCDVAMRQVNSGGAFVESIHPWFGLVPGVGPSGVIPVWSLDRWRELGAHEETPYSYGLTFAFGFQAQQQQERRRGSAITPLPDLKQTLGDLLATGDCGEWVKKLINKAGEGNTMPYNAHDDNILNIYDDVQSMSGIALGDFRIRGTDALPGDAVARGNRLSGSAGITIVPFRSAATGTIREPRLKLHAYGYTVSILHELIHHSSLDPFTDQQLAQAAVLVGGLTEEELNQWNSLNKNDAIETSRFWNDLLQKHCPFKE